MKTRALRILVMCMVLSFSLHAVAVASEEASSDWWWSSSPSPVYRFWSQFYTSHHYTISEAEKNYILHTWPDYWTYEGVAWYAFTSQHPGTLPVFRFWSPFYTSHHYTISEFEKNYIIATWSQYWIYEGIAWYAFLNQHPGTLPVYRFWSQFYTSHHYTISEAEKNYILHNWPDYWVYEGIAFYAYTCWDDWSNWWWYWWWWCDDWCDISCGNWCNW